MDKINQKVELTANIFIIVIAVLLGVIIVQKYFLNSSTASGQKQSSNQLPLKTNSPIEISGVDFSKQPKTLILALDAHCRFCTESASFYKRLIENARNKSIKLIAIFPTSTEESMAYLNKLGITNLEVKQSTLDSIQVRGTPTLILTNEKGEITSYWVGKLTLDKETEVVNRLNS